MEHQHGQSIPQANTHKDPICSMSVREGPKAITYDYKGQTYYFCSPGCKRQFEKDPEKALKEGPHGHM
jgi:YHS domain-containing protein